MNSWLLEGDHWQVSAHQQTSHPAVLSNRTKSLPAHRNWQAFHYYSQHHTAKETKQHHITALKNVHIDLLQSAKKVEPMT